MLLSDSGLYSVLGEKHPNKSADMKAFIKRKWFIEIRKKGMRLRRAGFRKKVYQTGCLKICYSLIRALT